MTQLNTQCTQFLPISFKSLLYLIKTPTLLTWKRLLSESSTDKIKKKKTPQNTQVDMRGRKAADGSLLLTWTRVITTMISAMCWIAKGMNRVVDTRKAWNIPMVIKTLYAVMASPVITSVVKVQKVASLAALKNGAITHAWAVRVECTFLISSL